MHKTEKTVAIIGAGLSGLTCATQLQNTGYKVSVFEKSRSVGGRMSTRREGDTLEQGLTWKWQCDHGAQYFTARDPLFIQQINEWITQGVVDVWSPVLRSFGIKPDQQSQHNSELTRYVGVPGMTAPARQLANCLTIHCEQRVMSIKQHGGQWMLAIEDQTTLQGPFERVVLALPAQQVSALLAASSDISPAFSACATTLTHQHALSPCRALMLQFREPLLLAFDAAFVNPDGNTEHVLSWIARDSSKPGRPAGESWILHASVDWSIRHIDHPQAEIVSAMLAAFSTLTGLDPNSHRPIRSTLHLWRYAQALNSAAAPVCFSDASCGLGICGDWLNKGRVEGAWLSGYHLAQAIIADDC